MKTVDVNLNGVETSINLLVKRYQRAQEKDLLVDLFLFLIREYD